MPISRPARPIRGADIDLIVDLANAVEVEAGHARSESSQALTRASSAETDAANALSQVAAAPNALGTPNNPVTDPAAARPTGLTVVWWATGGTLPTNRSVGVDILVATNGTTSRA